MGGVGGCWEIKRDQLYKYTSLSKGSMSTSLQNKI